MTVPLGQKVGAGRVAEVFLYGDTDVIKLSRVPGPPTVFEAEAAAQRAAAAAGLRVPEVRGIQEVDGRPGLVMARLDGIDGLTAAERQPWRIWSIGRATGKLHRELARTPAPAGLKNLKDRLRHDIGQSRRVPERARGRVLSLLEAAPDGDRLCHGDFHPGNVIETRDGPVIIDFSGASSGDPLADHVNALIILSAGAPPPGLSRRERMLIAVGRDLFAAAYRSGYRAAGPVDEASARRWKPVIVARRLSEGIPEERNSLLRMLSRSLREAEAQP